MGEYLWTIGAKRAAVMLVKLGLSLVLSHGGINVLARYGIVVDLAHFQEAMTATVFVWLEMVHHYLQFKLKGDKTNA